MPENKEIDNNSSSFHLMVRDPSWLFVYWDIDEAFLQNLCKEAGVEVNNLDWILRLVRLENAASHDISISIDAGNWYVPVEPVSTYESSIGYIGSDGSFTPVIRGNKVTTPRMGVSRVVDPEWKIPEEVFYSLISPYKIKSIFSRSALSFGKSEWENIDWPISPSVSSSDVQKKAK